MERSPPVRVRKVTLDGNARVVEIEREPARPLAPGQGRAERDGGMTAEVNLDLGREIPDPPPVPTGAANTDSE
jgi:hypothetical protein